ncbi:MAG TPA: Crp/Fnr family transcriptional regulator [Puia sp.]|nr:Crp/Fnr family transcriptional regulator [Puia sp.]
MHEAILKNIGKHICLDKEETDFFTAHITARELPKKTILLKEGQPCKTLSYVDAGVLRAYHMDKDGRESTIMFAVADWWVTDMYCFLNERPAMMYIEAMENSRVFQITKANLEKLYLHIPKFERFFRILMQNAYTREQLRVIENLSLSAKERYDNFLSKYPNIAKLVTQKQIASYLGITPEFLSAVRKQKRIS